MKIQRLKDGRLRDAGTGKVLKDAKVLMSNLYREFKRFGVILKAIQVEVKRINLLKSYPGFKKYWFDIVNGIGQIETIVPPIGKTLPPIELHEMEKEVAYQISKIKNAVRFAKQGASKVEGSEKIVDDLDFLGQILNTIV